MVPCSCLLRLPADFRILNMEIIMNLPQSLYICDWKQMANANHEKTSCPYFKLKAHSFTSEDHPLVICGSISTNFYGKKNTKTWRTSQWYQAAPNRFTFGVCLDAHHLKSKNGTGTNASATAAIGTWGVGGAKSQNLDGHCASHMNAVCPWLMWIWHAIVL